MARKSSATMPSFGQLARSRRNGSSDDPLIKLQMAIGKARLARIERVARRLDWEYLDEKVLLLRDDVLEILRLKPNVLMQRNVWSSLDAMAMALDKPKLMSAVQATLPRFKQSVRLNDPDFLRPAWISLLKFRRLNEKQAIKLGLDFRVFAKAATQAEKHVSDPRNYRHLLTKRLTFMEIFRHSCARPAKLVAAGIIAKLIGLALLAVAIALFKVAGGPPPNIALLCLAAFVLFVALCLLGRGIAFEILVAD